MKTGLAPILSFFVCCFLLVNQAQADSWSYGQIDKLESFSDFVMVRWNGPNTEGCHSANPVHFDASTLGSQGAFDRSFSIALAAAASGKPIMFHLNGCISSRQLADAVQYCTAEDYGY